MELVSFSPLLFKLFIISLLCKRLLILYYLTNVHIYFVFIFVHNFFVLFSLNWKYPLFLYRSYSETGCRKPRLMVKNCCNFFKHSLNSFINRFFKCHVWEKMWHLFPNMAFKNCLSLTITCMQNLGCCQKMIRYTQIYLTFHLCSPHSRCWAKSKWCAGLAGILDYPETHG